MDVLNCCFAEIAVDLCPCDNIIPYETSLYGGERFFNGAPFSYWIRKPHLYVFLLRFVEWHINIDSSVHDWPETVQKHADTSTLKKAG